jgi:hypothetical protein
VKSRSCQVDGKRRTFPCACVAASVVLNLWVGDFWLNVDCFRIRDESTHEDPRSLQGTDDDLAIERLEPLNQRRETVQIGALVAFVTFSRSASIRADGAIARLGETHTAARFRPARRM